MNNKRTLLFTFFTMSFILLFDSWQTFNGHQSFFTAFQLNKQAPAPIVSNTQTSNNLTADASKVPSTNANNVNEVSQNAKLITLKTDLYEVNINTLGGSIQSLKLLKYLDKDGKNPVQIFGDKYNYQARSGLSNGPNHTNIFTPTTTQTALTDKTLVFSLSSTANNIELIKTYTFYRNSYVIDTDFKVINKSNTTFTPDLYVELLRNGETLQESMFYSTFTGPAIYTNEEKYQKINFSDLDKNKASYPSTANDGWIAMVQHYFVSSWIMPKGERKFYAENISPNLYRVGFRANLPNLAPNTQTNRMVKLFAGPQQERLLENTADGLDLVKDYGWVTMFAKPLFWLLENIFKYVENWGWSIILLTLFLKTIFFPLTAASQRSMAKMKNLQPKVTALKERFANEPQKMQQEMLAIYRTEKVNPMGGCLPMLIQIPVFIALYFVLLSSVEMRNAPWISWIQDLSKPDTLFGIIPVFGGIPIGLLPILMAVSMYVQIKLNPKPADPLQAKVMLVIPMVFSVMFFFFPSGLVLYYVVNNLLSILQQWYINRSLNKPVMQAIAKAVVNSK